MLHIVTAGTWTLRAAPDGFGAALLAKMTMSFSACLLEE
jgi:hypothetical protein